MRIAIALRRLVCRMLVVALFCATGAQAQLAAPTDSVAVPQLYPEYSKTREIALLGMGAAFLVPALFVSTDVRDVPASGLDPSEISWGVANGRSPDR